MTASLHTQEKGKFPAQPQPNRASQCHVSTSSESQPENVNSIITLRSGKVIDKTIHSKEQERSTFSEPESNGKDDGKDNGKHVEPELVMQDKLSFPAPFPQ